ncbi:hypothetical protein [Desemzia sp. FAM 24101]|uniref:hypothetical protein n=1 Tax=unclassified Desemzia TaxID=2685243 RepID=UPI00388B8F80
MDDYVNEQFKKISLVQQYRNKELKEAVYPTKVRLNRWYESKTEEEIQEAITTINQNYDVVTNAIYVDLNKDLESKGLQTYKKGE